jgi:hypothetical protein
MTGRHRLLVGLIICSLALAGISWGQTDAREGKGGGPSGLYNPQTVVNVAGVVVSMTPRPVKQGLPYLVYLTLQTDAGKVTVFLGPSLHIDKMPVQIKVLDRIQVTGSNVIWEGEPVILAAEVKKGDQVLKLRTPDGVPAWTGRGRS